MGSWSSRVWGPRAGAAEGAAGPRGGGAFSKRKRGEGLSESESGDESEGEERLLSTPRRYGRGSGKPPGWRGVAQAPEAPPVARGSGGFLGRGRPRWGGDRWAAQRPARRCSSAEGGR